MKVVIALLFVACLEAADVINEPVKAPRFKRSMETEMRWEEIGTDVCYHGNSESFGVILLKKTGFLKAIKLVHRSGAVHCSGTDHGTNWGCGDHIKLDVFVTDEKREVLFPPKHEVKTGTGGWYSMAGSSSTNDDLVMQNFCYPPYVRALDHLQVWWGEDLTGHSSKNDNSGKHCIDVYAAFESAQSDADYGF